MGKSISGPGDFQQPRILDGRVDAIEERGEVLDARRGIEVGRNLLGGHPGRVRELGVIVVAENLVEMARGRPVGVDMGVRVINRPSRDLVEESRGPRSLRVCGVRA